MALLSELNAQQIREVVLELGEDADRQYAPRLPEVRAIIVKRMPNPIPVYFTGPRISMRACEMEAEVRVYMRD